MESTKAENDGGNNKDEAVKATVSSESTEEASAEAPPSNDEPWINPSAKRRLAPQFSLSSKHLGAESSQGKSGSDANKKKVKFSKEELISRRQPSKILSVMSNMLEIASMTALDPVCTEPLEHEDVIRIWNTERNANNKNLQKANRTRATSNTETENEGIGGTDKDWSRNNAVKNKDTDLWDDASGTRNITLDLADFAAAALKFRSEMMEDVKKQETGKRVAVEEDTMEKLLREEKQLNYDSALLGDDELQGLIEEDDDLPDWAMEDGDVPITPTVPTANGTGAKRNLLLETLNVKKETQKSAEPPVNVTSNSGGLALLAQLNASSSMAPLTNNVIDQLLQPQVDLNVSTLGPSLGSSLLQPQGGQFLGQPLLSPDLLAPRAPLIPVTPEWFYRDPQMQVQGPFSQENMRQWHLAGYFVSDLPIKLKHWSMFYPFMVVFPDINLAFLTLPPEPRPNAPAPVGNPLNLLGVNPPLNVGLGGVQMVNSGYDAVEAQRRQQQLEQQEQEKKALEMERLRQQQQQQEQQRKEQLQQEAVARQQAEFNRREEEMRAKASGTSGNQEESQSQTQRRKDEDEKERQKKDLQSKMQRAKQQQQLQKQEQKKLPSSSADSAEAGITSKAKEKPVREKKQPKGAKQEAQQSSTAPAAGSSSSAPWAKPDANKGTKLSLTEIQEAEEKISQQEKANRAKNPAKSGWATSGKSASSSAASLQDIQKEEEQRRQQQPKSHSSSASASTPAAGGARSIQLKSLLGVKAGAAAPPSTTSSGAVWGSGSAGGQNSSLRDIMKEEDQQKQTTGQTFSGKGKSSWAAKAGTGSGVNSGNSPIPLVPAAPQHQPTTTKSSVNKTTPPVANRAKSVPTVSEKSGSSKSRSSKEKSTFGGREMTKELEEWCAVQLKKLNGSTDITLMQFCMSLDSAVEIREYLAEYLGSSPSVTNFATEFIKCKNSGGKQVPSTTVVSNGSGGQGNAGSGFVSASKKKKGSSK